MEEMTFEHNKQFSGSSFVDMEIGRGFGAFLYALQGVKRNYFIFL
jgi:hypothetical protein